MDAVVAELIRTVGLAQAGVAQPTILGEDPALPSVFRVGTAAAGCIGATLAAAAELWRLRGGRLSPARLDVREAAISFRSERYLRLGGRALELWDPLSGDYQAGDGRWVRLHCNYAHHRRAAAAALGAAEDRPAVAAAVGSIPAAAAEERVVSAGGCAAMMRTLQEWRRHPQCSALAQRPLVDVWRLGGGDRSGQPLLPAGRPLERIRVLDLTRVIAGPVCGRVLASLGAEVLRVGAGHLPDADLVVIDTGFGKRFCHLDLRTEPGQEALRGLVRECDVFLQGYRPGALARRGFGMDAIAELRPGVVCVSISAYGGTGPWGARRGFDSLVQMVTGIAHEGAAAAGVDEPRPLPAQALDHGTGWLAALGVIAALIRRREEGGSWAVELSLARTSQWLDGLGRINGLDARDPTLDDVADLLDTIATPFGEVTHVRPPGSMAGNEPRWETPPHRPGEDGAVWL
jgi:CoA-transferase family III